VELVIEGGPKNKTLESPTLKEAQIPTAKMNTVLSGFFVIKEIMHYELVSVKKVNKTFYLKFLAICDRAFIDKDEIFGRPGGFTS
jgi:hypothetical protein